MSRARSWRTWQTSEQNRNTSCHVHCGRRTRVSMTWVPSPTPTGRTLQLQSKIRVSSVAVVVSCNNNNNNKCSSFISYTRVAYSLLNILSTGYSRTWRQRQSDPTRPSCRLETFSHFPRKPHHDSKMLTWSRKPWEDVFIASPTQMPSRNKKKENK